MDSPRTNLRLSEKCREDLAKIQESAGLKTMTAAIERAAATYAQQADMNATLRLIKKYLNELRRNDYLILDLLNAFALQMDVSQLPPHHIKNMRSPALQSAHDNLSGYLNDVLTRNKTGAAAMEDFDE